LPKRPPSGPLTRSELDVLREERSEVDARHLRWRPPQRLPAADPGIAVMASEGRAQVRRAVSGEKERTQDGIERCHLDIRPGPSSDRFGNYIGLLRSEASLLHRKGRHIADGIDAEDTLHAAVVVDWDKTVGIMRKSLEIRAAKEGQGDYGIDRHLLAAEQLEAPSA
jgi:hypothetical protein